MLYISNIKLEIENFPKKLFSRKFLITFWNAVKTQVINSKGNKQQGEKMNEKCKGDVE